MDRLTSLTAFVRVVDSGGFSAAGRKLNMSTMGVNIKLACIVRLTRLRRAMIACPMAFGVPTV